MRELDLKEMEKVEGGGWPPDADEVICAIGSLAMGFVTLGLGIAVTVVCLFGDTEIKQQTRYEVKGYGTSNKRLFLLLGLPAFGLLFINGDLALIYLLALNLSFLCYEFFVKKNTNKKQNSEH